MAARYDPIGTMRQTQSGHYMTYAEHEALVQELLESIGDYFRQVERGELTAQDAETATKVFVRIRD